jgi:SAM-dependent methyltransferase
VRIQREYFEDLYAAERDPWQFETSEYESDKYARTIAALEGRRYARGLEVGCSIGVLTRRLAASCDAVLALDVSQRAVATARERQGDLPGVRVERSSLPEDTPDGPFDLIVCSEVLYYWDRELLEEALEKFSARLEPGGSLLAVHWRPRTATYPLQGDEVHAVLRERLNLEPTFTDHNERYLLDRFDRPA